jgi:prophage antirepressor-like protein
MANLQLANFTFSDPTGDPVVIRTAGTHEQPMFCVADVCKCLGIVNVTRKTKDLEESEKVFHSVNTPGGVQNMLFTTESGLYKMVITCRNATKPGTVPNKFFNWLTSEVLPSIRKTGAYSVPEAIRPAQKQLEFPLEYAKFLNAEYKGWHAAAEAKNNQREADHWYAMIKHNLQRTHNIYMGKADDAMMIEDAQEELLTVTEIMSLMGAPYNSYAYMKQKGSLGKFVASRFRQEFPDQDIEQTLKTLDNGHRTGVKAYRNRAWVESVIRDFFETDMEV